MGESIVRKTWSVPVRLSSQAMSTLPSAFATTLGEDDVFGELVISSLMSLPPSASNRAWITLEPLSESWTQTRCSPDRLLRAASIVLEPPLGLETSCGDVKWKVLGQPSTATPPEAASAARSERSPDGATPELSAALAGVDGTAAGPPGASAQPSAGWRMEAGPTIATAASNVMVMASLIWSNRVDGPTKRLVHGSPD